MNEVIVNSKKVSIDPVELLGEVSHGRAENIGHAMLRTFVSGFNSGLQFKQCRRVHSVS
jgi:hypothetical protein